MRRVHRPIRKRLRCEKEKEVYRADGLKVSVTLICKHNGGKGDALNMGINASAYPYFLCIDADSMLQKDSLEKIVQPVMEENNVVAVGGLVRASQSLMKHHRVFMNPIYGWLGMVSYLYYLLYELLSQSFRFSAGLQWPHRLQWEY